MLLWSRRCGRTYISTSGASRSWRRSRRAASCRSCACEHGLTVLYLAGERPYVIDRAGEDPARRAALVERDGLDRALLCLSSPLGIERLCREQAVPLLDAYHEGALALGGAVRCVGRDRARPARARRRRPRARPRLRRHLAARRRAGRRRSAAAPARACSTGSSPRRAAVRAPRARPRPACRAARAASLAEPLWWPALTSYVAGHAGRLARLPGSRAPRASPPARDLLDARRARAAAGRAAVARAAARAHLAPDPLLFYETSSYGPVAVGAL